MEGDELSVAEITRNFMLLILGRSLFCSTGDTIHQWCLPALEDVNTIGDF